MQNTEIVRRNGQADAHHGWISQANSLLWPCMLRFHRQTGRLVGLGLILLIVACQARAAEYFVALDGSDSNSGSKARPFRTIQKAAGVMGPGDTCFVRAGLYREVIRPKVSGTKDAPIRFTAWPGDVVVLSGAELIEAKWSRHKGSIYKGRVAECFDQLFVDGQMMIEARWPNMRFDQRFDKTTWAVADEGSEYGLMVDRELAETGIDFSGAVATLNVGSWQTYRRIVRDHKEGADRFRYDRDMPGHVEAKKKWAGFDRYYLSGRLEALDAPGEWHLDRETQTLYLWTADGGSPAGHRVEAKVRDYAFEAEKLAFVELNGFHFFAATFKFESCTDCVVDNCHLLYPTWPRRLDAAVPTLLFGSRNVMRNSSVIFADGPGVTAGGDGNTLDNCLIHDIDFNALDRGHGVSFSGSATSTVRNCTIFNMGSSEGLTVGGRGPSVIEYNHIYNAGLLQSDGALIQCHGIRLNNTVIRYNWVHDHNAFNWGGNGIRGDDLTRDLIVHHNVVWNCPEKGIIVKGDRNRVYNNTCLRNPGIDILAPSRAEPFKSFRPSQHPHLLDKQNANTHIANNAAPVISGTFKWQKEQVPPLGRTEHNYRGNEAKLTDPAGLDFSPRPGSVLIDAGRPIEGITDGFLGGAPDIGAYESGGPRWLPGCRNGLWISAPKSSSDGTAVLRIALQMPPIEPVFLTVESGNAGSAVRGPRSLRFTPSDWMHAKDVTLTGLRKQTCLRFTCENLGGATVCDLAVVKAGQGRVVRFDRPMVSTAPVKSVTPAHSN